jgi:hypothetical protein
LPATALPLISAERKREPGDENGPDRKDCQMGAGEAIMMQALRVKVQILDLTQD